MSEPDPTRIVADADVLAADVLIGGQARNALDVIRSHSWLTLLVTDELLSEAEHIIAQCSDEDIALAWRTKIEDLAFLVEQPPDDHPALAAAYHGNAAQILSFDDELSSAKTGATLRPYLETSVRSPDAFLSIFDPKQLYPVVADEAYPGPDRNPRV
jgi:predicted nucleic acid-binding protein